MSDYFINKASNYDKGTRRVANVDAIIKSMLDNINFSDDMHLMDFGAGTGLLLSGIAPYVRKITGVDISPAMMQELAKKVDILKDEHECELQIVATDLTKTDNQIDAGVQRFDGVISSMTLHHIEDIPALFAKLKASLKPEGFIALADLDIEAGDFHTEDTGVFHHGFDRQYLCKVAEQAGFKNVQIVTANEFVKNDVAYSVFLLTAVV